MQHKIEINNQELKIIQNILQKNLPKDTKVWVFGSRALFKAKRFSDLDLAIEINNNMADELDIISKLEILFEESDLPWKVDILDYNTTSGNFRGIIDQDKIQLYP